MVRLRRAERMRKLRAFALVAPLLFFLLLTFVAPILDISASNPSRVM